MSNPTKPGGGNKPEPYIAAGNGSKSGEYTNKTAQSQNPAKVKTPEPNRHIRNSTYLFNPLKSKLVKKVDRIVVSLWGEKVPTTSKPNTVIKKVIWGEIVEERYYNEKGEPYLDIHYTNHGNPKVHPLVPHIHRLSLVNGVLIHQSWEKFE